MRNAFYKDHKFSIQLFKNIFDYSPLSSHKSSDHIWLVLIARMSSYIVGWLKKMDTKDSAKIDSATHTSSGEFSCYPPFFILFIRPSSCLFILQNLILFYRLDIAEGYTGYYASSNDHLVYLLYFSR